MPKLPDSKQRRIFFDDEIEDHKARAREVVRRVSPLLQGSGSGNAFRDIATLRDAVRSLIDSNNFWAQVTEAQGSALTMETPNNGKPWSQEEDQAMIMWKADDGSSMDEIARSLGRTSAACATRLSQLVGISRDEVVERYIEGTLNEVPVRGSFRGRIA